MRHRILYEPLDLTTNPWPEVSDNAKDIVSRHAGFLVLCHVVDCYCYHRLCRAIFEQCHAPVLHLPLF